MTIEFKPASFNFSQKTPISKSFNPENHENKDISSAVLKFKPASFKFSPKKSSSTDSKSENDDNTSKSSPSNSNSEKTHLKDKNSDLPGKSISSNLTELNNAKNSGVKSTSSINQSTRDSSQANGGIISALLDVDINTPNKDLKSLYGIGGLKSQSASSTLMELKRLEKLKEEELAYFLNNPSLIENRNSTQKALYINQKYQHLIPKGLQKGQQNDINTRNSNRTGNADAISAQEALLNHHQYDMAKNHEEHLRISALQKKMGKNVKRTKAQQKLKQKAKGSSYNDKLEQKRQIIRSGKKKR